MESNRVCLRCLHLRFLTRVPVRIPIGRAHPRLYLGNNGACRIVSIALNSTDSGKRTFANIHWGNSGYVVVFKANVAFAEDAASATNSWV